jgi:hypothetical protein
MHHSDKPPFMHYHLDVHGVVPQALPLIVFIRRMTDGRWPQRIISAPYRVAGDGHSQMVRATNREAEHREKVLMAEPMVWARRRNSWEHPKDGIPTVAT